MGLLDETAEAAPNTATPKNITTVPLEAPPVKHIPPIIPEPIVFPTIDPSKRKHKQPTSSNGKRPGKAWE